MEDPLSLSFFNYIIKSCNDYHSILAISTRISINGHSLSERGTCMWPIFVSVSIHQGLGGCIGKSFAYLNCVKKKREGSKGDLGYLILAT